MQYPSPSPPFYDHENPPRVPFPQPSPSPTPSMPFMAMVPMVMYPGPHHPAQAQAQAYAYPSPPPQQCFATPQHMSPMPLPQAPMLRNVSSPFPALDAAAEGWSPDPLYKEFGDVGCTFISYEQLNRRTPPPDSARRSPAEASTDTKFFVGQLPFGANFDFFQRLVALVAPWQTVRAALGDAVAPKFNNSKQRVMHSGTLFVMVPKGTEARFLDALTERIVFDAAGVWLVDGPEQRAYVAKYLRQHQHYIKRALHLPYNFLNVEPAKRQQHPSQQDASEEAT